MRLMILLALLLVSGSLSAQTQGAIKRVCHVSRFELAVACIKKYEGLHGPKHHPYVGYGHKLLPGEKFSPRMTERQADALLRSDLRKLCLFVVPAHDLFFSMCSESWNLLLPHSLSTVHARFEL